MPPGSIGFLQPWKPARKPFVTPKTPRRFTLARGFYVFVMNLGNGFARLGNRPIILVTPNE